MEVNDSNNNSKDQVGDRYIHIRKYIQLALAAIIICCVMMFTYTTKLQSNETAAIQNAEHQAKITTNSDICRSFPSEPLCVLAKEITANPTQAIAGPIGPKGETGNQGLTGPTGLGIQKFVADKDGRLIVTFSDGTTKDFGAVVGEKGDTGPTGAHGLAGIAGPEGLQGTQGDAGRSITQTAIQDGQLVVTYSDGVVEAIGNIVGPQGATGPAGTPGEPGAVGTDGQPGPTGETGATGLDGPPGVAGKNGTTISQISTNEAGEVSVTYTDGTTTTSAVVGTLTDTTEIESISCVNNTLTITIKGKEPVSSSEVRCVSDPLPDPSTTQPN